MATYRIDHESVDLKGVVTDAFEFTATRERLETEILGKPDTDTLLTDGVLYRAMASYKILGTVPE